MNGCTTAEHLNPSCPLHCSDHGVWAQCAVSAGAITVGDCLNPEPVVDIEIDETASFMVRDPVDIRSTVEFANGSSMTFESGRIGHLSESAVVAACRGTMVFSTATSRLLDPASCSLSDDGVDLKVDADFEILLCRMIDRSIRPLFCSPDEAQNGSHHIDRGLSPQFEVQVCWWPLDW